MARFEGEAARLPEHLRLVAKILRRDPLQLITPTERRHAADAIDHALTGSATVTRFLAQAPAEDILRCACPGCDHLKSHLADLRKVAHR